MSSLLYFKSIDEAREAISVANDDNYLGSRVSALEKLLPNKMRPGSYNINRLHLFQRNDIENYSILIDKVGLYPLINFVDSFDYHKILDYIDEYLEKDTYKRPVERIITCFLCCAVFNDDIPLFNAIVDRVFYHSTKNGEYFKFAMKNIILCNDFYIPSSGVEEERLFYLKRNVFIGEYFMSHTDIDIPRSVERNLVVYTLKDCPDQNNLSKTQKSILNKMVAKYREFLIDEHNSRSRYVIGIGKSYDIDSLFDYIESDSFMLKNLIDESDNGWYNTTAKSNVESLIDTDRERFVRACVSYFNSNVRRVYQKEKIDVFNVLNRTFPKLDAMETILPKLSDELQTNILASLVGY